MSIPKVVFIIPYRDREQQKHFFKVYQSHVLMNDQNNENKYEIYFSHQMDVRTFNRGGMKNIGFLAIKNKYPEHYKDITFVFNDIDTIPYTYLFDYVTVKGIVKHFYGFKYALGGIVSITGADFERVNGYPSFWGWGMEDNVLQKRCEKIGIIIDRTQFYPIGNKNIIHLFDGVQRIINQKDPWRATHDDGVDGVRTINKLKYTIIDEHDTNTNSNIPTFMIEVETFLTAIRFEDNNYIKYDLREPPRKIINPKFIKQNGTNIITDDWSNIPYYPTINEKKDMIKNYGEGKTDELIEHNLKHTNINNYTPRPNPTLTGHTPMVTSNLANRQHPLPPPHKYSPAYAHYIGVKPRATTSANIRLGGVY